MNDVTAAFRKLAPTAEGLVVVAYLEHMIKETTRTLTSGTKDEFEANQGALHAYQAMRDLLK